MFAVYAYSNSATLANIIKDIGDILTGTTNKANLSAGCAQADTSIATDYTVAGWTMWDNTANDAAACTMTIASPCVVSKATHGLIADEPVSFTTTDTLPTGLVANTTYYVVPIDAGTFSVAATPGGAAINTSGSQAGTHKLWTGRKQVLRAAVVDDATKYKYAILDYTTAGYVNLTLAEGWAITSSAKTVSYQTSAYATTGAAAGAQRLTVGTAAKVRLFASARRMVMQSAIAAGIGADTNNCWLGILERSRLAPWDTVAAGYLPAVLTSGYALSIYFGASAVFSYGTRYKTLAADVSGSGASLRTVARGFLSCFVASSGLTLMGMLPKFKVPDGQGGLYCPFTDFGFSYVENAFPGGDVGAVADVWIPPQYANLDKTTYNSKVYLFLQNTNTPATTGCIAVPMG